ncbi:MAG: hypothetical protein GXP40_12510 [Chloroflexi bacterium]|nr:hypothetical protein [Chloroflexota bacterium]
MKIRETGGKKHVEYLIRNWSFKAKQKGKRQKNEIETRILLFVIYFGVIHVQQKDGSRY